MIFRNDFESKVCEVENYFSFLEKVECEYIFLFRKSKDEPFIIDDELFKILKANGFLILYNLIESTILNTVVAIFDEIKQQNLSYTDISEKIRLYWSKHKYKYDETITEKRLFERFHQIVNEIINNIPIEIINRIEYGGSLDANKIRKVSNDLGIDFSTKHYYKEDKHGKCLQKIKEYRNSLVHGKKSFSEIGREMTYNEIDNILGLKNYKDFTIEHLTHFLDSVEEYIKSEKYKI